MANLRTDRDEKQLLVAKGLNPRLAGVIVPKAHPPRLKTWEYRDLLAERLHRAIAAEPNAHNLLRDFLSKDPEEPLELLNRPRNQWASDLLNLSVQVHNALGTYAVRPREEKLSVLRPWHRDPSLEEWLVLVNNAQT